MSATGFYGKLPAHGDFIRRNLPGDAVAAWDGWAASLLQAGPARLGAQPFAAAWDAMPCWCLSLPGGACGAAPLCGVMAASRDAVGRRFPLLLAAPVADAAEGWFAALAEAAHMAIAAASPADALLASLPPPEGSGAPRGWWNAALEWAVPALPPMPHALRLLGEAPA